MGNLDDFQNFRRYFENELERLESAPIADADRDAIGRFIDRRVGELAVSTLAGYAVDLRKCAEWADTPLTDFTEDEFWALRSRMTTNSEWGQSDGPLSPRTVHRKTTVLRLFCQHLGREWAEDLELSRPDPPSINADDMLTQNDIAAMRQAGRRNRRIALVEFLADTGARLSMAGSLRVGDVSLEGDRAYYTPNENAIGLKGADLSQFPIIDAKGVLRTYLRTTHPRPDDPDVALFHRFKQANDPDGDRGAVGPHTLRKDLRTLADRADIDKPVNPHNFRHSAITRMVREGYSRTEIEHRVHWSLDTDMWDRYVHLTAEQVNDDIYSRAGLADGGDSRSARRDRCPNCTETLPAKGDYCPVCSAPVTKSARDAAESVDDTVSSEGVTAKSPIESLFSEMARRWARENPELAAEAIHDESPPDSMS